ncbi:MAG TPA: hypothetical protein VF503_09100 [Sphingobium sp.]|uniref:hypothetical protein n=1 Tax=Sphingobium sp. TaxID=1912891 RepID=UPI002ED5A654
MNGGQLARGVFEVVEVPCPSVGMTQNREPARSSAVRRIASYELLCRRGGFSRPDDPNHAARIKVVLDWYASRVALAGSGLFKSPLASVDSNAGVSPMGAPARAEVAAYASSEIAWADSHIRPELLPTFRAIMVDDLSLTEIVVRAANGRSAAHMIRVTSAAFKAAAEMLLVNAGNAIIRPERTRRRTRSRDGQSTSGQKPG